MRRWRDERGQTLIVLALLAVGFVGLLALVLDVGSWYHDQRKARNVADAAALAGARSLPNQSLASSIASNYASQNGGTLTSATFSPDAATISVTAQVPLHTYISKAFGAPGIPSSVSQSASATFLAATTVQGARPFVFSADNRYLSGSACGHPGQACLGSAFTSTFTLGSGEEEEGEEHDGFGLACLNAPDCPRVSGGDLTFQPSAASSTLSASDEEGGVNCLTPTWTGWVRNGYPGTLSIPARYPRCRGSSETAPLCNSGRSRGQSYLWNYTTKPGDNGDCNNQSAVGSLQGTCFFVLVAGRHGEEEGDDLTLGGSSASDEEDGGNYNAIGWARFCMTGAPVFGGSGEEADNSMTGYFDAFDVGGPPVGCIPGPTECFYGVGTVALSK